jgi:hypothetical protein
MKTSEHLFDALQSLLVPGFDASKHESIAHCKATFELLKSWNNDANVCAAGLFQSVYTYAFTCHEPNRDNRQRVQGLIGIDAERLVYLYTVLDRRLLVDSLACRRPPQLRDAYLHQDLEITSVEQASLMEIHWASLFETLGQPKTAETERFRQFSQLYRTAHLVSEGANKAFRTMYFSHPQSREVG